MPTRTGPARLFADDYSSSGQLQWSARGADPTRALWERDFVGQLRFDTLVSATLVVPDTHVFDGPFFLRTDPSKLTKLLGRDTDGTGDLKLPVEVRGRAKTLSGSLARFLRRVDKAELNAFSFKSIGDPRLRAELADELGRTPASELDRALKCHDEPATAVASLLRRCLDRLGVGGNAEETVGPLEQGWRRWSQHEHLVRVEMWPLYEPLGIIEALAQDPVAEDELRTHIGRRGLGAIWRVVEDGSRHRADVSAQFAPLRAQAAAAGDDEGIRDLDRLDWWYSRARYRALAVQHGCAFARGERAPVEPAVGKLAGALRAALGKPLDANEVVPMPHGVITRLGTMPSEDFRRLAFEHFQDLNRWWSSGQVEPLRAVAEAIDGRTNDTANATGLTEYVSPATAAVGAAGGYLIASAVGHEPGVGAATGTVLTSSMQLAAAAIARHRRSRDRERILELIVGRPAAS